MSSSQQPNILLYQLALGWTDIEHWPGSKRYRVLEKQK